MKTLMSSAAALALAWAASAQAQDLSSKATAAAAAATPAVTVVTLPPAQPLASASTPAISLPQLPVAQPAPAAAPVLSGDEQAFFAAVGHHVTNAAAAYDGYVHAAAAIDPGFHDAGAVQQALRTSADYQPQQLQEGVVAFAALLALRDQTFVEGVRAQADAGLAQRLIAQPQSVLAVPGAAEAAADVVGVLRADAEALQRTGAAVSHSAYSVQAEAWSKQPVANPAGVLSGVEAEAAVPRSADDQAEKHLLHTLVAEPRQAEVPTAPAPAVVQGLALAALSVLGAGGDSQEPIVAHLLRDAVGADCVNLAKMNLNQCLAAAGPHYEDIFCTGEHGVGETAKCLSSAAADTAPGAAVPSAMPAPTRVASYGPEEAAAYGYAAPADPAAPPPTAASAYQPEPAPPAPPPSGYAYGYGPGYAAFQRPAGYDPYAGRRATYGYGYGYGYDAAPPPDASGAWDRP